MTTITPKTVSNDAIKQVIINVTFLPEYQVYYRQPTSSQKNQIITKYDSHHFSTTKNVSLCQVKILGKKLLKNLTVAKI